jgi:hypothetical protein
MRKVLMMLVVLLAAFTVAAQEDTDLYLVSNGELQFELPLGWVVNEVDPPGSVLVFDSENTGVNGVTEAGQVQISVFPPSYVAAQPGDTPAELVENFTSQLQQVDFEPLEEVIVDDWAAVRQMYSNPDFEGYVVGFEVGEDGIVMGVVTVVLGDMENMEDVTLGLFTSVALQPEFDVETETFVTQEIGISGQAFQFEIPTGWTVEDMGNLFWATNLDAVEDFTGAPGEQILVVSPSRANDIMMLTEGGFLAPDSPIVENNPLSASFGESGRFEEPEGIDLGTPGEDYAVTTSNLNSADIVALVRVIHNPDEQAEAAALGRFVRDSIAPATPEGFVTFEGSAVTLEHPDTWEISEAEGVVQITLPEESLELTLRVEQTEFVDGAAEERFIEWMSGRGLEADQWVQRMAGPRIIYYVENPGPKDFFGVNYEFQFVFLTELIAEEDGPLSDATYESIMAALGTVRPS